MLPSVIDPIGGAGLGGCAMPVVAPTRFVLMKQLQDPDAGLPSLKDWPGGPSRFIGPLKEVGPLA